LCNATKKRKNSHGAQKFLFAESGNLVNETPNEITAQLIAWSHGDEAARDTLIPAVYQELRRMADHYFRGESPGHSLQPTALVHEAYLRLIDQTKVDWQNRAHFFGVAAQMMRRILVDHAKAKHRVKRGGTSPRVSLDETVNLSNERDVELVALDEALKALEQLDERKSHIVELRYFGGLTVHETAQVLGVSDKTVMRDWNLAKAWLYQQLSQRG
jgi:RNA polymerase sigma factor (TIGR02999 family)